MNDPKEAMKEKAPVPADVGTGAGSFGGSPSNKSIVVGGTAKAEDTPNALAGVTEHPCSKEKTNVVTMGSTEADTPVAKKQKVSEVTPPDAREIKLGTNAGKKCEGCRTDLKGCGGKCDRCSKSAVCDDCITVCDGCKDSICIQCGSYCEQCGKHRCFKCGGEDFQFLSDDCCDESVCLDCFEKICEAPGPTELSHEQVRARALADAFARAANSPNTKERAMKRHTNVSKRYKQLRKEGMETKQAMQQARLDCGADEEEKGENI